MIPGLCEMKSEMKLKMTPIEEDIVQLLFTKTIHNGLKKQFVFISLKQALPLFQMVTLALLALIWLHTGMTKCYMDCWVSPWSQDQCYLHKRVHCWCIECVTEALVVTLLNRKLLTGTPIYLHDLLDTNTKTKATRLQVYIKCIILVMAFVWGIIWPTLLNVSLNFYHR